MPQTVQGVIARARGAEVELVDVVVPDPGPGEAVVRVEACGVCHTDLHYREGGINDDFPFLLGHEAAGTVESVGEGVTDVAPGDFVILNWRAVCGQCRACLKGKPWYCFATHNATQKMTLTDGTELTPALGIGAFIEKTLVASGQCTKVDRDADAAAVGLLGCGVMAGFGAAVNTGGVAPRRLRRGHRMRWGRQRGHRRCQRGRGDDDHRRRRRRPEARGRPRVRRHPHGQLVHRGPDRGDPRAHRRPRRRRGRRGGGPARDLRAGLLRPRPRRHGRARRRADARQGDHPAADRRLRPRRCAEVELVRRLPALARLPDARRPLPAGPLRPRRVRQRADRHRRRRGRLRQDAPGRRAALGRRHGRRGRR